MKKTYEIQYICKLIIKANTHEEALNKAVTVLV
jgi:hypothetical protein